MGKSKEVVVSQADQKAAKEQDSMKNSVVNVPKIMENTATSTSQTSSRNLPTTFVVRGFCIFFTIFIMSSID